MKATEARQPADRTRARITVVAVVCLLGVFNLGAQDQAPLGDVARAARAQHTSEAGNTSAAEHLAEQLEKQQQMLDEAPQGFQSYTADGYRVWVPAPFSVEGRDENGTLLATDPVTGITTRVFAGNPLDTPGGLEEMQFKPLANQFWAAYGKIDCKENKVTRRAHVCTVSGYMFNEAVSGSAVFITGQNSVVPVVCFATVLPFEDSSVHMKMSKQEVQDRYARYDRNEKKVAMAHDSARLCDTVLTSVFLKEDLPTRDAKVRQTPVVGSLKEDTSTNDASSLGDIARHTRSQAATRPRAKKALDAENTFEAAPPGYKRVLASRCADECWQESFIVPADSRRVKGGRSENVYVSGGKNSEVVVFYGLTDSEYQAARAVAIEWLHVKPEPEYPVPEPKTVDGHKAGVRTFYWSAPMDRWQTQEMSVYSDQDRQYQSEIGCAGPENRVSETESVCSSVIESWRTGFVEPRAEPDDPPDDPAPANRQEDPEPEQ